MPKPRCPSSAANSLEFRIAGRQVPKPKKHLNKIPALRAEGCLDLQTKPTKIALAHFALHFIVGKPWDCNSLNVRIAGCQPRYLSLGT